MKHTLYRIDDLKIIFVKYKFQIIVYDKDDENETYFNIFKLHIMTHYVIFIRLYDSVQDLDIVYEKHVISSF